MQSVSTARSYSWVMRHLDRLSDDALLAAVALEERDAAAVFIRRFQRRVYGLAVTMIGDAALADDIAQITFERAWRHAGTYDARRASVATWLLTITRNLAIDATRVRRAIPFDPDLVSQLLPPSSSVDPQQAAVDVDQLGRLGVELAKSSLPSCRLSSNVPCCWRLWRSARRVRSLISRVFLSVRRRRGSALGYAAYAWRSRR